MIYYRTYLTTVFFNSLASQKFPDRTGESESGRSHNKLASRIRIRKKYLRLHNTDTVSWHYLFIIALLICKLGDDRNTFDL